MAVNLQGVFEDRKNKNSQKSFKIVKYLRK